MKNNIRTLLLGAILLTTVACNTGKEKKILKQTDFPNPPVAEVIATRFENFGGERVDNYYWMKDKENPKVIEYLNEENAYTKEVMGSTIALQEKIYDEILGRIKDEDETYPVFKNGYYNYSRTEKGKQYRIYCRKAKSLDAPEEIIFDVNKMAEGKSTFIFGSYNISPNNKLACYFYNETGSFAEYTLKIKNLETDEDLDFSIDGVTSSTWANDNNTLFYTTIDETLRSCKVYRRALDESKAELIYEEKDARFRVGVSGSKTKDYIFIYCASSTTTQEFYISANEPKAEFKEFLPRVQDVEYSVYTHKENFYLRYKDKEKLNGELYKLPLEGFEDRSTWELIVAHNPKELIEGIDVIKDYLLIEVRRNGLSEIRILPRNKKEATQSISFPEPVYTANLGGNPEYDTKTFRYTYTSLNRPTTLYQYDIATKETEKLKEQEIPSGFNPDAYTVERLWSTAPDGVKVPMAIVYKKNLKKNSSNPTLLYSYGSYGHSSDVYFSAGFYSLIDRGFVLAIAQIRGGSDLGEQWYEDGKLLKKKNTFNDFIACAEKLIDDKYTAPSHLTIMGGSAGGLLVGAVANMRPDLFNCVVAQVPFVDVVTTMLDDTLPLTTGEYEEWGNPNEEDYYKYMLSYSPYDNVVAQNYPNMLITGGINDSQVLFHEPSKWAAKLRSLKTDDNVLLLHMNMDSGHGGATGRYDRIKDTAFEWAFMLKCAGIDK